MSAWDLPTEISVKGQRFSIRSDFRAVLDALAVFSDNELSMQEKATAFIRIMIPDWENLPDHTEAFREAMTFVNLGKEAPEYQKKKPTLVDWEKDVFLIAPAVDKVLGFSCRRCDYLHWWEFIGAYNNINDGLFSLVVAIRKKRAEGRTLEKAESQFVRENPELVALPSSHLTKADEEFFKLLGV